MRIRRLISLVAVLVSTTPMPARATAGDEWPLLAGETNVPQGWVSFKIATDGAPFAIQIYDQGFTSPVTYGAALYGADGTPIQANGFSAYYATSGTWADVNDPNGTSIMHVDDTRYDYSNSQGGGGFTPVVTPSGPGTFKLLVWAAARPLEAWRYALRGAPGVELLAQDAGSSAFFWQSADFDGVARARVTDTGRGARVSVATDKVIDVEDTLFAWYLQPFTAGCCQIPISFLSPNFNAMSITTPTGERDCTLSCTLWSFKDSERSGAGRYTFHLSGAGATPLLSDADDVSLIGVDARLPD